MKKVYVIMWNNGFEPYMTDNYEQEVVGVFDDEKIANEIVAERNNKCEYGIYWYDTYELNKIGMEMEL